MVRNETNSIIKWNPKSNLNFILFFLPKSVLSDTIKKRLEHIYI